MSACTEEPTASGALYLAPYQVRLLLGRPIEEVTMLPRSIVSSIAGGAAVPDSTMLVGAQLVLAKNMQNCCVLCARKMSGRITTNFCEEKPFLEESSASKR